ncbi:MAG: thermonuclease family protein [Prevotella sp.]|nr:thermonuclease family protein [Prevotella sp.]
MSLLADNSVELIITSPPYWQLKDYGTDNQIGFHDSYENYINQLNIVWSECFRVLKDGCRLCINIGDQFARSVYYGRYKVIPIRTEIIRFCENIGMDYMGSIIWQKKTTMNTTGGAAVMGSFPYPRNGILKIDYEFILIFKKLGKSTIPSNELKEQSKLTKEEWNTYFSSHWTFPGAKQDKHIAVFPEELPTRLIKMFSFVGETVLDPFMGSGTTALAAKNNKRNSIGYEINPNYKNIYIEKVQGEMTFFDENNFKYITDNSTFHLEDKLLKLPYLFSDPHKMNNKIDVKLLQYGSKIDENRSDREDYYSIKSIIDTNKIILSNGLMIRLLGIKRKENNKDEAIKFLYEKTKGHRVFMKYDNIKYDHENILLCYLYLENKTFINAHLLKNNLADIDLSIDFKYKDKFQYLSKAYDF